MARCVHGGRVVAIDLKDSLGPFIGTALYAVAPRLPWVAGVPLVLLASLGLGVALGRERSGGAEAARTWEAT
jgi:MFS transporter, DHA1 family, tetracycline resistance protein